VTKLVCQSQLKLLEAETIRVTLTCHLIYATKPTLPLQVMEAMIRGFIINKIIHLGKSVSIGLLKRINNAKIPNADVSSV